MFLPKYCLTKSLAYVCHLELFSPQDLVNSLKLCKTSYQILPKSLNNLYLLFITMFFTCDLPYEQFSVPYFQQLGTPTT